MTLWVLTRGFLRDYARNSTNLVVLVLVPIVFVLVAADSLADAARLLGGTGLRWSRPRPDERPPAC